MSSLLLVIMSYVANLFRKIASYGMGVGRLHDDKIGTWAIRIVPRP